MSEALRLKKANCKNCCKCIRNCPVKSIKFSSGQANIVNDECILCGQCYVVCPQNAKEIVSETDKVRAMLKGSAPVVASVAPSFAANYEGIGIGELSAALQKLGFYFAEETARGAELVKRDYDRTLENADCDVLISSCCHSVNLLIKKYYPEALRFLAKTISPMLAHSLDIKRRIPEAKTVFIGPCIAKKDEAAESGGIVDAVLTFDELNLLLHSEGIELKRSGSTEAEGGGKSQLFPISGGIIRSMEQASKRHDYISVDGAANCLAALNDIISGKLHNCFIEMSICAGSCIGGPAAEISRLSPLFGRRLVDLHAADGEFGTKALENGKIETEFLPAPPKTETPTETEIKDILAQMGKTKPEDELNCGTCGYNSCREKATAIYRGKAEISMCLPYLKEKAESFSGNILSNTPNGIIVLNSNLEVLRLNKAAMKIMNIRSESDILGEPLVRILDPKDFLEVQKTGRGIYDKKLYLAEYNKYVEETIVFDKEYGTVICFLRDVSHEEEEREKKESISRTTIETADKVVDKQMRIVQEIASLLGETAAETKIALTKLKESIADE